MKFVQSHRFPCLLPCRSQSLGARWRKLPASTPTPISTRATEIPSRIETMAEISAKPTQSEAINQMFTRTSWRAGQAGANKKTPTMTRSHSRSYQSYTRTLEGELHRLGYRHYNISLPSWECLNACGRLAHGAVLRSIRPPPLPFSLPIASNAVRRDNIHSALSNADLFCPVAALEVVEGKSRRPQGSEARAMFPDSSRRS